MEAELAALAASGATTVVGLMAGDGWNAVKSRVAALLRRGSQSPEDSDRVESELELERREVAAAQDEDAAAVIADLETVWRSRLRQLLSANPSAAAAIRELIADASPPPGAVHNTINGGDFRQAVIQTGNIHGDVRLG